VREKTPAREAGEAIQARKKGGANGWNALKRPKHFGVSPCGFPSGPHTPHDEDVVKTIGQAVNIDEDAR
jgi:hypothetical protein